MFDDHGNLAPGFHDWTLKQAEENLVEGFPESRTRRRIGVGYLKLCVELLAIIDECEHWLDGSFVTAAPNPADLDLLVVVDRSRTDSLPGERSEAFDLLVKDKTTRSTHGCDSYLLLRVPEGHPGHEAYSALRAYWTSFWGFDRHRHAKGIVRMHIDASVRSKVTT